MHVESVTSKKGEVRVWTALGPRDARYDGMNALQRVISQLCVVVLYTSVLTLVLIPLAPPVWAQDDASIDGLVRDAPGGVFRTLRYTSRAQRPAQNVIYKPIRLAASMLHLCR
jgi:hypothetical protein